MVGSALRKILCMGIVFFIVNFVVDTSVGAMDLHAKNSNLAQLVTSIARSEHINLIGAETLSGTITADLYNMEAIEILQQLSKMRGFEFTQEGDTWIVAGETSSESTKNSNGHNRGESLVLTPVHLRPDKLQEALAVIISPEKSKVLKETNQLVIYGTDRERRQAKELFQTLDVPPKQVYLKATVLALESSYAKETGISWSWLGLTGHGEDSTHSYGAISFGKASDNNPYKFFYKPELKAMESTGKAVLVAEPNIMTMNGEEGKILIGDRVPVLEESKNHGETTTSIHYEEAGIRLTYTPYLTEDDYIDTEVKAEVSTPILVPEMKAYKITTREAQTRVRLKAGEVLVIGGLMDKRQHQQKQKIPLLGDIPLLGKLFQHARKSRDTVELFILVKVDKITT